jgi:large subunit ribosomal protein L13
VEKVQKTFQAKEADVEKKWYLIDANGKTLGRLATQVARLLRGKHKPIFTPHVDVGDFVVVVNASKVGIAPKREEQKAYFHHSGYPGGAKWRLYSDLIHTKPTFVIEQAVKGMLPHNKLGRRIFKKLKVYAGSEHPHQAQKPEVINV